MSDPVSVGIIGCGSVMQHAYMPLLASEIARGKATPPKVCDIRADRIADVEEQYRTSGSTHDPDEIIDDPDLDLVLILTAMAEHGGLAERAMRAGRHVLVEKPMSVDLDEAARLVELDRPAWRTCSAPHTCCSAPTTSRWPGCCRPV
jgi:predicted dehydrogenase